MTKFQLRNLEATLAESVGDLVVKRQRLDELWQAVEQTQAYITWRASADDFTNVSDLVKLMLDCKKAEETADELLRKIITHTPKPAENPPTPEAIAAHHTAHIRQQQMDGA